MVQQMLFPGMEPPPQPTYPILPVTLEHYPKQVKVRLAGNAPGLYALGNLNLLQLPNTAVVGTKATKDKPVSDKGNAIAKDCVRQLVTQGRAIVTGFNYGIDRLVAKVALTNQGCVILVLSHGFDNFFKNFKENDWIFSRYVGRSLVKQKLWDWDRVLILSQFSPQAGWSKSRAKQASVTTVALSHQLIVVEAYDAPGDLEIGEAGLRMGLPVFTPEFSQEEPCNAGNFILLRQGALPLRKTRAAGQVNLQSLTPDSILAPPILDQTNHGHPDLSSPYPYPGDRATLLCNVKDLAMNEDSSWALEAAVNA